MVRTFLCGEERGKGTSQTSLVTSLPAQARELLGQAVAYNSSYSSRLEEREGLATQGDIEQEEEPKQERKEQQRDTAQSGRRTVDDEVGAKGANGGHGANGANGTNSTNDGEHSDQEEAGDTGVDAGDTGDDAGDVGEQAGKGAGNASESDRKGGKEMQEGNNATTGVEAVIASQGWQGGKRHPPRVRRKIDKFNN